MVGRNACGRDDGDGVLGNRQPDANDVDHLEQLLDSNVADTDTAE
jgi:hypothetical protein